MRLLLVSIALLAVTCSAALADNDSTTLVMHAVDGGYLPCAIPPPSGPDPCVQQTLNTALIVGNVGFAAYLMVRNYDDCAAIQTAFDWPAATMPFTFGLWDCQTGQVNGTVPTAPGATTGTIATAFNAIVGGLTSVIGRLHFAGSFAPGCISQIDSSFPFGTHMVDGSSAVHPIIDLNRGSICTGTPGVNACDAVVPVEPTTWGNIKSQYR